MKICLICYKYNIPLDDPCCYPLGFMYVSSILKQRGHTVKVLNYNLFDYVFEEEIKDQDTVMFTGFEEFFKDIVRDSAICKKFGIYTVLGGALATFKPELMKNYVDELWIGEFEKALDLCIVLPDYEGFGIEEYNKRHKNKFMGVLTSRGCPYNCTFCTQTCKFSLRTPHDVFAEIEYYKTKYNIDTIIFNDNTFNTSKKRFMRFCSWLKDIDLEWSAAIRCDIFDDEMAKAAKESGCKYFVVGVESFEQKRLDKMNKRIKVEDIYRTLNLLNKYEIKYHGNILLGFEDETYEDIINRVENIPTEYNVFPILVQPFVGTNNGKVRLITDEQAEFLSSLFLTYLTSKGLYQYPALEEL
jgi:radical SAM superfamily enzyme YgiQ (UPF0313 family)